jgi:2-keto-4-pentenoate hydratase
MTPDQLLQHFDQGTLWTAAEAGSIGGDVAQAYQQALQVRRLRMARGEVPRGYKIGFTNRNIWPRYGVFAPIWGTVWDSTLQFCEGDATISLAARCQPRLEPEAVFGMRATPPANASLDQLFDSIDWLAPGFEIVQSHAPDWKFNAAMTVADSGLHSRLLVGQRIDVRAVAPTAQAFSDLLATCPVVLHRNGALAERGLGRNVLDSPLLALQHFLTGLRQCPGAPDLLPGDVVTTGTWTDAWPLVPGETWQADFGAPLSGLSVSLT